MGWKLNVLASNTGGIYTTKSEPILSEIDCRASRGRIRARRSGGAGRKGVLGGGNSRPALAFAAAIFVPASLAQNYFASLILKENSDMPILPSGVRLWLDCNVVK